MKLFDISEDLEEDHDLSRDMPEMVQKLDRMRTNYLDGELGAETVTLTRRNYVELLEGGWITNGKERLVKLKAN